MGNLMTSIYTGVSGIQSNQTGLNVVSHNLANVNTEGFVRQQMVGKDKYYNNIGMNNISTLQVGYGTSVATIRQVRSVFLDKAYRVETGRKEFYKSQSEAASELEGLFGEISGEAFSEDISDFWTSIQELSKEPDSIVKRAAVVSRASTLIERATSIYNGMTSYQQNLNQKILQQVNRVNEIGHQIVDLNDLIVRNESDGQNANDMRDTRNALLDELSEIVKISYEEDPTGRVTVAIEGRQFVSDVNVFELSTTKQDNAEGLIDVTWQDEKNTPLYDLSEKCVSKNNSNVGGLKGLLVARGNKKGNYLDIPVRENYASDLEYNKAVDTYNSDIANSIIPNTQAQFDQLVHGIVSAVNNVLSPTTQVGNYLSNLGISKASVTSLTMSDGTAIALDSKDVLVWDEANAPVGMEENNTPPGEELFSRKYTKRYTEATLSYTDEDGNPQTKTVFVYNKENKDDIYSQYTLGQIMINPDVQKEVSKLPLSGTSNAGLEGAYDMKICSKLSDIFSGKFAALSPNEITQYNFSDYYTALTGSVATKGHEFNKLADSYQDMAASLDNQRQQIMGVSSEEELTNMLKYQWAYSASSKYMNVINDLLETVINNLG